MINREKFIKEIAEVINRNSMERAFNDTPDYILACIAADAMEMFAKSSASRDVYHEFSTADYRKNRYVSKHPEEKPVGGCEECVCVGGCPDIQTKRQPEPERKREYKNPQAFDIPEKITEIAKMMANMFPGAKIELHRIEVPRNNPRNKRRKKNKRNKENGGQK